jgi:hypothetical protein
MDHISLGLQASEASENDSRMDRFPKTLFKDICLNQR